MAFNRKDGLLAHLKVHAADDIQPQDETLNLAMRTKNEMFNSTMLPRNEYEAPMNLVVTEQSAVQQKMHSSWPNLDIHETYGPFQ